jgi:mannose-6-phosphate isomerase-like protein (cupin superfamily)
MPDPERDPLDRLNDHLDSLAAGAADGAGRGTDSEEADLIQTFTRLRRLDARRPADDEISRQIWEELTNEATLAHARPFPVSGDALRSGLNGRAALRPWRAPLSGPQPRRARGPSLLAQAATLLLVAVTILAVFVAVVPNRLLVSPPLQALTPATDEPETPLFTTTLTPDRDASPLDLAFWRGSIAPGAQVTSPPDWAAHPGTEVELVLGGTLVLQADEAVRVHRAASSPEEMETVPAGEPVLLSAGDAATIPFTSTRTYRNAGDQPLELLGVLVFSTDQPVIETMSLADGLLVRNGNLVGVIEDDQAPKGPLQLTISRLAGAENAWPAQTIRSDGVVEWRMLESLGAATPGTGEERGTVYVLTLGPTERSPS